MSSRTAGLLVVVVALPALWGCPAVSAGGGALAPVVTPAVPPPEGPTAPPEPVRPPEPVVTPPEPIVPPEVPPEAPPTPEPGFLGGDDAALLRVICDEAPVRWERNRGGTTISFRLTFADGTSAAFKPEQTATHSRWEAEVAAYRLSHRLGIDRVPPSCPRRATREELLGAEGVTADFRARLADEVQFDADGTVQGMAMYWVPDLRGGEEFDLGGDWRSWLAKGGHLPDGGAGDAAALSDMLLLDWLTLNTDRWTGGQIRRQGSMDGPIVLIDNAAGFGEHWENNTGRVWPAFEIAQRFRVPVVERLRAVTDDELDALLDDLLDPDQLAGLHARLGRALQRIDELIDRLGEDSVLYFQ